MNAIDRVGLVRAWTRIGIAEADQRRLLRDATTIDRMNEALCNGGWPCDNGERTVKECIRCAGFYAPSDLKAGGRCSDCRAQARVAEVVERYPNLAVEWNGDPRGLPFRIDRLADKAVAQ